MKLQSRLLSPFLGAVLAAVALAACGSSNSSTTGSAAGGSTGSSSAASTGGSSSQAAEGTPAQLAATIKRAYGTNVNPSSIPPIILQSLKVASAPITPALEAQFKKCMSQPICDTGHGTLTLGIAEPTAADLGNLDNRAGWTLQALRYPQIKRIIFTNANGDTATAISNFRSLVSQHANIITGLFSAGPALLAAAKQATAQGSKVIEYTEPIPGAVPGKDVVTFLGTDICAYGAAIAKAAYQASGNKPGGSIALYTGPPGNPYGATWQPCTQKQIKAQGWTTALTGNTNWNAQGEQQAASALIASGKNPAAIGYDYTPQGFVNAYLKQGKTPPIMIAGAGTAGYFKSIAAAKAAGHPFPAYISNSQGWLTAPSVTAGILAAEGKPVPPNLLIPDLVVPASNLQDQYSPTQQEQQQMNLLIPLDLQNSVASSATGG
jgi:ABC-type sugar transport system substrate-binding protein